MTEPRKIFEDEELRSTAHAVADWIVGYFETLESRPVKMPLKPGDIRRKLPTMPPDESTSFGEILQDFARDLVPGLTHWQHPKFFGYFPANISPASVFGETLAAALGVQGMSWITSPAATELELTVCDWLRQLMGLPEGFHSVIQDSASAGTMVASLVARERATGWTSNDEGLAAMPTLTAYCSAEAHSSVQKAIAMIGIGRNNLRKIPVDQHGAVRLDLLRAAVERDRAEGRKPFLIVGAFGTTGTTGIDDLASLAEIAAAHECWFHVDAAYAGAALLLPEMRALGRGIELADSIVMNPHKWLLTNFDCSLFLIKDREALVRTLSVNPEYLQTYHDPNAVDLRDWGPGLGRRFRALKLWFVLRRYGAEMLRAMLREHLRLARHLENLVDATPDFERLQNLPLNLVCFRWVPKGTSDAEKLDELNLALMHRLNDSGEMFLSHTRFDGKIYLRMVTGQASMQEKHVDEAWQIVVQHATV